MVRTSEDLSTINELTLYFRQYYITIQTLNQQNIKTKSNVRKDHV